MSKIYVNLEQAQNIAIEALGFLAQDELRFKGFLDYTGLDVGQIRLAAQTPQFFEGVMDYLLSHETLLLEFAQFRGIDPALIAQSRPLLVTTKRSPRSSI